MSEEGRPSPEELLYAIKQEEIKKKRGFLKIFLGMAAGVGKTYAMLEEAQKLHLSEVYIVSGTVDTHGRIETAALLKGLKEIPEKWVKYKDTVFEELDIDEILKLKPQLVLIDELAHSNVPGSRHPKRWQDVNEILDNGIDVFSTLNVQHIESLKDIVEDITGISMRETVPDSIIESASAIQIIDITPQELLRRLREGKVYLPEQSELAALNFFQEDRLTALRQLLFQFASQKIDHDLQILPRSIEYIEEWKSRERLLVAINEKLHSKRLIRAARRIAYNVNASWMVLHVDDGKRLDGKQKDTLAKNLALARDLGAEVVTISDPNVAQAIERVAKQRAITQIIIGKGDIGIFPSFLSGYTVMGKLAQGNTDADLHVIRKTHGSEEATKSTLSNTLLPERWMPYFLVTLISLGVSALCWMYLPFLGYQLVGYLFLVALLSMSLFFPFGPVVLSALLLMGIWNYYFIPQTGTFTITKTEDIALTALFLVTAILAGILGDRSRTQKGSLIKREETAQALYEITRDIANFSSTKQIIQSVKQKLHTIFNAKCEIIIKKGDGSLGFDDAPLIAKDEKERNAALWVYENGKEAGWSTNTLPSCNYLYLPLKGFNEIIGVLAYQPVVERQLSIEEKNFIYTINQQLANHVERTLAEERRHKLEYLNQSEKFYQIILDLISNQFQNPLTIIRIAISELKAEKIFKEHKTGVRSLYRIEYALEKLIHIIENITIMAKINTGLTPINKQKHSLKQLIDVCVENISKFMFSHKLKIQMAEDIPELDFDFSLLEILISNLIFNAIENSPPDTTIEINVKRVENSVLVSVADEGPGIPEKDLGAIFEKFYRLPGGSAQGLGIGLSIAKTIAEIHGGNLKAENRPTVGSKLTLFLPVSSKTK